MSLKYTAARSSLVNLGRRYANRVFLGNELNYSLLRKLANDNDQFKAKYLPVRLSDIKRQFVGDFFVSNVSSKKTPYAMCKRENIAIGSKDIFLTIKDNDHLFSPDWVMAKQHNDEFGVGIGFLKNYIHCQTWHVFKGDSVDIDPCGYSFNECKNAIDSLMQFRKFDNYIVSENKDKTIKLMVKA